ncbi:hypothetical protein EBR57_01385 [bacterium]|nr:hypothetical protein [bacterium]
MNRLFGCGAVVSLLILGSVSIQAALGGGHHVEVLEMGFAAAPLAVAESVAAISENTFAGLYNPASGTGINRLQVTSIHSRLSDDIEIFGLGATTPSDGSWVTGILWTQYQVSGIPLIAVESATPTQDVRSSGNATYASHALTGFCSVAMSPKLSLGLSVTGFLNRMGGISSGDGWGITVAPGFLYSVSSDWTVGGYIQNLVSLSSWATGTTESFSRFEHLGTEYRAFGAKWTAEYVVAGSQFWTGETRIGVAIPMMPWLTVRLGASIQLALDSNLTGSFWITHLPEILKIGCRTPRDLILE